MALKERGADTGEEFQMFMDGIFAPQQPGNVKNSHLTDFWYSRRAALGTLAVVFFVVQLISVFIPPFQSPDEPEHIERAYLLSKGEVFLGSRNGITGGDIDTGLLAYINSFRNIPFQYDQKINASTLRSSDQLAWSGKRQFSGLPDTAAYFPLPYLPQALALAAGARLGLTVGETYFLARASSLLATLALLWLASVWYPAPPIVVLLFVTPMTLFQLASPCLDPVAFGLCALAAALFMRGSEGRFSFDTPLQLILTGCTLLLAVSRTNLVPMILLPAALHAKSRSRCLLGMSAVSLCLAVGWISFVLVTVKGIAPVNVIGVGPVAKYYVSNPTLLLKLFIHTFDNAKVLKLYWYMFVGVLGHSDTPLDSGVYYVFGVLLLMLAGISLKRRKESLLEFCTVCLFSCAALSMLLVFLIGSLLWTPIPGDVIVGIQGRYFTPILILFGYSVFGRPLSATERKWGLFILAFASSFAVLSMVPKLLHRYWLV